MTADKLLLLQAGIFLSLLSAASFTDIRERVIPNSVCVGIALTGLILFSPVRLLGILAALPFLLAAVLFGGVGGGDVKLVAAAGVVLGLDEAMAGAAAGLFFTLLFHALRKALGKPLENEKQAAYPLAPFLSAGFLCIYFLTFGGKHL